MRSLSAQDGCHCPGLRVTVYDPDAVTPFNVGRQLFYQTDLGRNKALCLVGRVNMAYGTNWRPIPSDFFAPINAYDGNGEYEPTPDVIISCVDTAAARRQLHELLWSKGRVGNTSYWLDCGNLATVGQVVLGQPGCENERGWPGGQAFDPSLARWKGQRAEQVKDENGRYDRWVVRADHEIRLPCVTELFPDLLDPDFDETDEPSCSMVEALRKQSLFVNRATSAYALDLLWELIREGKVDNQGCYFNLRTRTAQPIPLKVWPVQPKRSVAPTDGRRKRNKGLTDGLGTVNEATKGEARA